MSLLVQKLRTPRTKAVKISLLVLGFSAALGVASAILPSTGAWFFTSQTGTIAATTATMSFSITDEHGMPYAGPADLNYDGLAPGMPISRTFTIKNTGSIPGAADVTLSNLKVIGPDGPDETMLKYTVDGGAPFTLAQNRRMSLALGQLAPNESRTVTISLALDDAASSEWQNVKVMNTLGLVLTQVH